MCLRPYSWSLWKLLECRRPSAYSGASGTSRCFSTTCYKHHMQFSNVVEAHSACFPYTCCHATCCHANPLLALAAGVLTLISLNLHTHHSRKIAACIVLMVLLLRACRYQDHHGVRITDAALAAAATLSDAYLPDRQLPDKAIDLIDEAAAKVRAWGVFTCVTACGRVAARHQGGVSHHRPMIDVA
jgi:hypothetical protein